MKKYTISLVAVAAAATFALASCKKDSAATTTVEPTDTTTEVTPTTTAETVDAATIAKTIIITNNGDKVSADFDLPASVVYNNQAYKITWSTESEYLTFDYPEDDEETKDVDESVSGSVTAKVTRPDIEDDFVVANFTATVEVDGKTGTQSFKVRILRALTPEEERNNFYNGDTTAINFKGVVLFKAGYNTSYNEGNVYVHTEAGNFYVYNGYISQAEYDALVPGQTVSVTNATVSPYNGWVETKYGSTITVEDDAVVDVSEYLVAEDVTKILADSLNDSAAKANLLFKQNAMAKVSARFVESYADDFDAASTNSSQSLAKFEVNGKTVLLSIGGIVDYASETATAAVAAVKAMTVGNYYDLTGMLTWYNACDIVVTGTDFAAEASIPDWAAPEEAMKDIDIKAAYVEETNVTLTVPADVNLAVTIKEDTTSATYDEETKTLTFKPTDTEEIVTVVVTITKGDYSAVEEYSVSLKLRTPQEMLEIEAEALEDVEMYANSSYAFAETGATFDSVSISYALKEAHDFTDVDEDVITVTSIDADFTVTVVATLTCKEETITKEITVTVTNPTIVDIVVNQPVDGQSYKLGLYQPKADPAGYYYFAGAADGNYLTTTQNYVTATDVTVTKNEDGTYYLSFKDASGATKYLSLKIGLNAKGTAYNVFTEVSDTAYAWKFDTKYNTFYARVKDTDETHKELNGNTLTLIDADYYFGTYNTFTTFSASKLSYASTSYPSNLLEKKEYKYSRSEKADYEATHLGTVGIQGALCGSSLVLPEPYLFEDVTVSYAMAEDDAALATIENNKLTVPASATDVTFTVVATFECGGIQVEKEIEVTAAALTFESVTAIDAKADQVVNGEGVVYKLSTSTSNGVTTTNALFLTDGENYFEIYGNTSLVDAAGNAIAMNDITVGTKLQFTCTVQNYKDTGVMENNGAVTVYTKAKASAAELLKADKYAFAGIDSKTPGTKTLVLAGTVETTNVISYAVKDAADGTITLAEDGKTLKINEVDAVKNPVVTVTITASDDTAISFDYTLTVNPITYESTTDALDGAKSGDALFIKATVTDITNASKNKVVVSDGQQEITLYNAVSSDTKYQYSELAVGDIVTVYGIYAIYGTTKECTTPTITSKATATDAEKVAFTLNELANQTFYADTTDVTLATNGTIYTTVTLNWSVADGEAVTITGGKYSVTRDASEHLVAVTVSATSGTVSDSKVLTYDVKSTATSVATCAYTTATTTKMDGTDQATLLGLDTEIFNAVGTVYSGTDNVGLNKAKDIRLYQKAAQSLDISVVDGYVIDSIKINVKSGTATDLSVVIDGTTKATLTDGIYVINGQSIVITDIGSATIQISSIEITYTKTTA